MHLYLHIPFCESKCFYCSFTSLKQKNHTDAYFKALLLDLKFQIQHFELEKKSLKTIFIGGGTPSVVKAHFYEAIFKYLQPFLANEVEITSEANPSSSDKNWLKTMKDFGLNRISFGAQSFHEKKLAFLGRIHKADEIYKSVQNAKELGFSNINLDMIYDTKLDDTKMLDFELKHLDMLKKYLNHISAYHLSIEPHSAFKDKFTYKKNASNLMRYFIKNIENLGFKQYEISNFGKKCKHNLAYWQGKDYIGCGLSSVGFKTNQRYYTQKSLQAYIKDPLFRKNEFLDEKALTLERLFLGFRSCVGVKKSLLNSAQNQKAELLHREKKLISKQDTWYSRSFLLADELALFVYS